MHKSIVALSLATVVSLAVACSGDPAKAGGTPSAPTPAAPTPSAPTPSAPTPAAPAVAPTIVAALDPKAEAEQVFTTRCALCHGADGKGETDTGKALNPHPRNYNDAAWQKSVTDDYIGKVILQGGAAVGKSPMMAANPDLTDKPEVVKNLVAKVRSFNKG